LSYLAAAVLLLGASGSASARPFFKRPPPPPRLTFTASDGTKIFPEYDSAGHVVGATGTDAAGVVRSIHFDTSVEWDKLNWNADLPFECYTQGYGGTCDYNGQTIPKVHLPDYCYPGYCEVAKTTIVGKYYERGAEVFHYSTVIDPYNYQVFLEMSMPDSRIYIPGTRTKVRYRLGMDGNGEQHLVYTGQADDVTLFSVDRQHGNALSIAPQFAGYFPRRALSTSRL